MTGALSRVFPIATVVAAIMFVWYGFTVYLNSPWQIEQYEKAGIEWQMGDLVRDTMAHDRPILPAPHQIVTEIWKTTVEKKITSKRSLIFHGGVTLSSTLLGFAMGTILGIGLAVSIVENRAMDKSLMPWIITSQTIPILAIAPMIIVVLNAVGLSGLLPKAMISTYLSFFSGRCRHGEGSAKPRSDAYGPDAHLQGVTLAGFMEAASSGLGAVPIRLNEGGDSH